MYIISIFTVCVKLDITSVFSVELNISHFNICTASKPCLLRTYPIGTSTDMRHCIHSFSGIPVHIGKAEYLPCSVDPVLAILEEKFVY